MTAVEEEGRRYVTLSTLRALNNASKNSNKVAGEERYRRLAAKHYHVINRNK
jgi:hypothetical protein